MVRLVDDNPDAPAMSLCSAIRLKGAAVRDQHNGRIGRVRDIVLFARRGSVSYAVIGFGGFLGLFERRAAVPWSRLRIAPTGTWVQLDDGRATLDAAPRLDSLQALRNFASPDDHALMYRLHRRSSPQPDIDGPQPS